MVWHVFGLLGMVTAALIVVLLLIAAFGRGRDTGAGDAADVALGAVLLFFFFWLFLLVGDETKGKSRWEN